MRHRKLAFVVIAVTIAAPMGAQAEPTATRLVGGPIVGLYSDDDRGVVGGGIAGSMSARLTADREPLPGKVITFRDDLGATCSATTNDNGVAACGSARAGFIARFAGDETFAGSEGAGCFLGITGKVHACVLGGSTLIDLWID